MRTVFRNHNEVCRAWAKQEQWNGRAGNILFSGPTIFSYGWWPMARIDGNIVLFRDESYSTSTSGHQNHAWQAVHSKHRIFRVTAISKPLNHVVNIAHYVRKARWAADDFWRSQYCAVRGKLRYTKIVQEARIYAGHYNCKEMLPALFGLELEGPKAKAKIRG